MRRMGGHGVACLIGSSLCGMAAAGEASCKFIHAMLLLSPARRSDKKVAAEWTPQMEAEATHYYLTNYIGKNKLRNQTKSLVS